MNSKRIASALVLSLIAVLAFSGGQADNGGKTAAAKKTEITYMCWYNTTQSESENTGKIIENFNTSQDKIHVTMMAVPRDGYETKVNTMAAAGELPDSTQLSEAMALQFAAAGLLADVGTMFAPENAPLRSLWFTYNGKPVGYSSGNEVLLLYYNKKLFDEAGVAYPPASADKAWTWDQYIEAAKKLTKDRNGKTPNDAGFDANNIVTYGTDFNRLWWMWPVVTYSNGGGLMSPDGKELWIGKPESMEAMQLLADLYLKHKVAPSVGDRSSMPSLDLTLLTGKVAMATSGQWEIGVSLANSVKDGLDYGVAVLPKMKKAVTYNTGAPYGVFKASKNVDAAMTFIKWYLDEKNQWPIILNGTLMPILSKYYASEDIMRTWADPAVTKTPRPEFTQYKTAVIDYAAKNAIQVPWYYFNGYENFTNILESGIENVWNGKTSAKVYITSMMPKLQAFFDEHKNK